MLSPIEHSTCLTPSVGLIKACFLKSLVKFWKGNRKDKARHRKGPRLSWSVNEVHRATVMKMQNFHALTGDK